MADDKTVELPLQKQIQGMISATQAAILLQTEEKFNALVLETETLNQNFKTMAAKKDLEELKAVINSIQGGFQQFQEDAAKNQKVIDNFVSNQSKGSSEKKDFGTTWEEAIAKEVDSKKDIIKAFQTDRHAKLTLDLKVGTMVIANVSGDAVQGYNSRQGLVPNQRVNIRDIIPTTPSPTGSFVTYRETGTSGSIAVQTEAQSKSQIDYSFTEVKTVSKYIAGYSRFSKQLMYALPFLQTTLPRQLLRDFYKKENDYFYSAMQTAAQGDASTTGAANTAEQILQLIANQRAADFDSSYILTDWHTWSTIMATSKGTGYGNPGAVMFDANGNARFAGVPLIGASFADAGAITLWDNEQLERVETESLRVEFSYEDQDNFIKNLVTAKVECFEELNVLRQDSIIDTTTS